MHNWESVGGVLCLHAELGKNSLFEPADEAVPGGGISSIFDRKKDEVEFDRSLQVAPKSKIENIKTQILIVKF